MFFRKKRDAEFIEDEFEEDDDEDFFGSSTGYFDNVSKVDCFPLQYLRGYVNENNEMYYPKAIDAEARETAKTMFTGFLDILKGKNLERMRIVREYLSKEYEEGKLYHFAGIIETILQDVSYWYSGDHEYLRNMDGSTEKCKQLERYLKIMMERYTEISLQFEALLESGVTDIDELISDRNFIAEYYKYDEEEELPDGTCDN